MKNFPDQDPFNELDRRLQDYTEQPDDLVWQNIDKALRPQRTPLWLLWADRITTVASIAIFAFLITSNSYDDIDAFKVGSKADVVAESSEPGESTNSVKKPKSIAENPQDVSDRKKEAQSLVPLASKDKAFKRDVSVGGTVSDNKHLTGPFSDTLSFRVDKPNESVGLAAIANLTDSTSSTTLLESAVDSSALANKSTKESKRIPKRGLAFYVSLTPQLSFQRIIPKSNDGIVISEYHNPPILSSERFGINIDAGVQGSISKRVEYYGGFSIYQQSQTLKYAYQSENNVSLESTDDLSYLVTPENKIRTVEHKMLNLGAQAGLLYSLQGRKLVHKMGAGLSYQHGFKDGASNGYDNSGSRYLFYQVFYRNEIRIGAKLSVFVQPTFSHSLYTSEKLDAPFNMKPYRAGLGFGILYDF